MDKKAKIFITGGTGLVGTALVKVLTEDGYSNVVALGSKDCDLTDYKATLEFFAKEKPQYVFHLAASVYGIMGNMMNKGASYLDNTLINLSVVEASRLANVEKIVCMGSGCVYPYPSPGLPLKEDMIWQGAPHHSEDSYALSKRGMLAQLNAYKESYDLKSAFVVSANLYGPNDKFDVEYGHVTPSLVRKFFEAKNNNSNVVVWGNGSSQRDFMYSDDAARALVAIMDNLEGPVNLGSGSVHSIREVVESLAEASNMQGRIDWDASKPNGQDFRAYDLSKLDSTGFTAKVDLTEGMRRTYEWYAENSKIARR